MRKHDVWVTITRSIAKMALSTWNWEVVGSVTFPLFSDVEIRFVSSVNQPRYQSKTIIWTLAEAFDYYNAQLRFLNCFLTTKVQIDSGFQNLGVASIRSTLSNGAGLQKNSSVIRSADEPSLELASNSSAISVST